MKSTPRFWFPAKRSGWGWSLPQVWEGWVALALWICALAFGLVRLHGGSQLRAFGFVAFMSALLAALCWLTGEPPSAGRSDRR